MQPEGARENRGGLPMQEGAHDGVLGGSGDKEGREAGVRGGFIAQRLHQLQQVVQQLLVLCALQHLHSMAPHLHPCCCYKPHVTSLVHKQGFAGSRQNGSVRLQSLILSSIVTLSMLILATSLRCHCTVIMPSSLLLHHHYAAATPSIQYGRSSYLEYSLTYATYAACAMLQLQSMQCFTSEAFSN